MPTIIVAGSSTFVKKSSEKVSHARLFPVIIDVVTYNAELIFEAPQDFKALRQMLEWERLAFNEASKIQFRRHQGSKPNAIIFLHGEFYHKFRLQHPEIPAQILIRAQNSVLAAYRSVRSNKHRLTAPAEKKHLSLRLDKRLYRAIDKSSIRITTAEKRKTFRFKTFPRLAELLKTPYKDPLIFERDGRLFIALTFDNAKEPLPQKQSLGVDLGVRIRAACSDGRLIKSPSFNARKRRVRYLKRSLRARGTKSAKRHLAKVRHSERNMEKNFSHLVANEILKTNADTIVLENLKGIKAGRGKRGTKQVPFYLLRQILTYKAENAGKRVLIVSPAYTSQTDPITGRKTGERRGRRFYANNGLVYDADISASHNIARRSKLPYSQGNLLAGQGLVNDPIVSQPLKSRALQATTL